jgi:hypothetical protein
LVTFSLSIAPLTPTGWAAPTLVPGAIAATGQLIRMKVPAEAARAPLGETKQMTGMSESRMARIILRIELSDPPGVSMVSSTAEASEEAADSMPVSR